MATPHDPLACMAKTILQGTVKGAKVEKDRRNDWKIISENG